MLYNEPDFVGVESLLETHCKSRGYGVIFLPKFHCELNFIEQCWGYAKWKYQLNPPSSLEVDLEANMIAALDSVPLESMRRYVLIIIIQIILNFNVQICNSSLPLYGCLSERPQWATSCMGWKKISWAQGTTCYIRNFGSSDFGSETRSQLHSAVRSYYRFY
jgi:hypothetical protein